MRTRYIFGIFLVVVGLMIFLDQISVWNFGEILSVWWPLIFVVIGLSHIATTNKSILNGLFFIVIGILLIANNLNFLPFGFWSAFWPLLLIFIGAGILLNKQKFGRHRKITTDEDINYFTLFSGANHKIESGNFKGGTVSTFFGGTQIDLRRAIIAPEGAMLELSAAFGGIEIKVPYDWKIIVAGTPILGGMENKTVQNFAEGQIVPTLKINYFVIFGGIDIKN